MLKETRPMSRIGRHNVDGRSAASTTTPYTNRLIPMSRARSAVRPGGRRATLQRGVGHGGHDARGGR